MDELEEKISEVLNDPKQMEKIMAIANSLGLSPPEKQVSETPVTVPPQMASILE